MSPQRIGQYAVVDDSIKRGDLVQCRGADGVLRWMVALTGVEKGLTFPRVWVCTQADADLLHYGHSRKQLRELGYRRIPWPRDAIVAIRRRVSRSSPSSGVRRVLDRKQR